MSTATTETKAKSKGLLFDMAMCQGCNECAVACMVKQGFVDGATDEEKRDSAAKRAEGLEALSSTAYTRVWETQVDGEDYFLRNMCRHCMEPSCASVCPVGALEKTECGPVIYDVKKCIGCRYCMVACPFNIPRYEWESPAPAVRKCDMCFDRVKEGQPTACAESCMFEATLFGDRDELLKIARERIEEDPDTYYPHIYGEKEIGGTSVMFIVPAEIAALGYDPKLGTEPLPALTWKVLSKIPGIVTGGGAALLAIWWITRRRDEVALVEGGYYGHGSKENGNGNR
jgi:formate dehydrogenase iron-sulfur subunit